jgi:hypothetical protein
MILVTSGKDRQPLQKRSFLIYHGYLYENSDVEIRNLLILLERRWVSKTKTEHVMRTGQVYASGSALLSTMAGLKDNLVYEELPIYVYTQKVIRETMCSCLRFAMDARGIGHKLWIHKICIVLLQAFIKLFRQRCSEDLIGFLVRARQYYPYAVDTFLLENECSSSFATKIYLLKPANKKMIFLLNLICSFTINF